MIFTFCLPGQISSIVTSKDIRLFLAFAIFGIIFRVFSQSVSNCLLIFFISIILSLANS